MACINLDSGAHATGASNEHLAVVAATRIATGSGMQSASQGR